MSRNAPGRSRGRRSGKQARATLKPSGANRPTKATASPSTSAASATVQPVPNASVLLDRDQEYAYIRSDLKRLVVIAGILLILMIGLLLIIG